MSQEALSPTQFAAYKTVHVDAKGKRVTQAADYAEDADAHGKAVVGRGDVTPNAEIKPPPGYEYSHYHADSNRNVFARTFMHKSLVGTGGRYRE